MKKTTLFILFILTSLISQAQFTTGEVAIISGMTVTVETQSNEVTLTLKGPYNKWFAIGFGGQAMSAVSDVFVYDGTGNFDKVGQTYASPINDATQDWTIVSNDVNGSQRVIVATRALSGSDSSDYTFANNNSSIPVIFAYGGSMDLSVQHVNRNFGTLTRTATANVGSLEKLQFSMYPNPVKDKLTIVLPSIIKSAVVEVYNMLGKKVMKQKIAKTFNLINTSSLDAGIYLIKVIAEDHTYGVKQFIKK